jgi:hypothetical protein
MSVWFGLFTAVLYGSVSTAIIFSNKALLNGWEFACVGMLIVLQQSVTSAALCTLRFWNVVSFSLWNAETAKRFTPTALLYTLNIMLGLACKPISLLYYARTSSSLFFSSSSSSESLSPLHFSILPRLSCFASCGALLWIPL